MITRDKLGRFAKDTLRKVMNWVVVGLIIYLAFMYASQLLTGFFYNYFYGQVQTVEITVPHAQDSYQNLIKWYFGKDAKTALAVATAENGTHACDRTHKNNNGTTDIGIFQINSIHAHKGNLYDCRDNVRVAYQIFKASGFSPWVAYQNGSYKKFLNI